MRGEASAFQSGGGGGKVGDGVEWERMKREGENWGGKRERERGGGGEGRDGRREDGTTRKKKGNGGCSPSPQMTQRFCSRCRPPQTNVN